MNKIVKAIIVIVIGIFMIPAIYALGIALFGTVVAFLANPKVMMVVLCGLAILALPGVVIVSFIKR
jgi:hypothetical protein